MAIALSKIEVADLKKRLAKIKAKPGVYFYCEAAADGRPVLLIEKKRIPSGEKRLLKQKANKKRFVEGSIRLSDDKKAWVFHTAKKPPSQRIGNISAIGEPG